MADVIDLCESGDDESQVENRTLSAQNSSQVVHYSELKPSSFITQSTVGSDDDDDVIEILDDDDFNESGNFHRVTPSAYQPLKLQNPYAKKTKTSSVRPTVLNPYAKKNSPDESVARMPSQDDMDSDDELFMTHRSMFFSSTEKKKSVPSDNDDESGALPTSVVPLALVGSSEGAAPQSSTTLLAPRATRDDASFLYPTLLTTSKTYPDIRARLILAFWKMARSQVQKSYEQGRVDHIVKKMVRLALWPHPIRSLEEYCFSRGVGGGSGASAADQSSRDKLKQQLEEVQWETAETPVLHNRYYSVAEACLVTMVSEIEDRIAKGVPSDFTKPELWVSLESLIPVIDNLLLRKSPGRLTRRNCADNGVSYYQDPATKSAEFLQIAMLERRLSVHDTDSCIKRHARRGEILFELRPLGYETALAVRKRSLPVGDGHYRCSRIRTVSGVDDKYRGICLGVDFREGGGGQSSLHDMCNVLEMTKVPYFVGTLKIGDYLFFTSMDGSNDLNYLCPILVERKSVEDVAMSIHDGRWAQQKRNMYRGQYVFGYGNCRIAFIIEGNVDKHTVTGGYVGQHMYNVTRAQLEEAVNDLKSEGFEVIMAPSRKHTMFELSRWTERVATDMRTGTLKAQYTYAEFKREVERIPSQVDFSRLARAAMDGKRAIAVAITAAGSKRVVPAMEEIVLCDSDDDGDVEFTAVTKRRKAEDGVCKFAGWSKGQLVQECEKLGISKSGNRSKLIARLKGPRPPPIWLARKAKDQYVPPRHNVGGTALLVGLYLHESTTGNTDGMTKDELYCKAVSLKITKNPFCGGTTQTGPYHYDGWSSMTALLEGDPPLVTKSRGQYKLTRNSNIAGFPLAAQMHSWCHQNGNCSCGSTSVGGY